MARQRQFEIISIESDAGSISRTTGSASPPPELPPPVATPPLPEDLKHLPEQLSLEALGTALSVPHSPTDTISFSSLVFGHKIAVGSFGEVYAGTLYGQPVALKLLSMKGGRTLQSYASEIAALSRLRHPNIIEYLGSAVGATEDGEVQLVVVMEQCRSSLSDLLAAYVYTGRKLAYPEVLKIAKDVARGLAWMHIKKFIHRDLKPANVLVCQQWMFSFLASFSALLTLDASGNAKLADFGLTRRSKMPVSGACGSLAYMAPEVDVYSFGVLLNELVTGRPPFEYRALSTTAFEEGLRTGLRPELALEAPLALAELIKSCWADEVSMMLAHLEKQALSGKSPKPPLATQDEMIESFRQELKEEIERRQEAEAKLQHYQAALQESQRTVSKLKLELLQLRQACSPVAPVRSPRGARSPLAELAKSPQNVVAASENAAALRG